MFRIESARRTSSAPPIPPQAPRDVNALTVELEQERTQVQRLRLQIRMRDDRLLELERVVADLRNRLDRAEGQLEQERKHVPDDLKRIRGIGPGFERKLHAAGVKTFAQVAAWTPGDIERMALELSIVPQRILRDGWVERARELASAP
jgi:predicted flap endonuclease-1-like 5' DNA nuclease